MSVQQNLFPYVPEDFPLLFLSQEALDHLLTQLADDLMATQLTKNVSLEDLYPISGMQIGLLFHDQTMVGSGVYVEHVAFQMKEKLHLEAFIRSWGGLLATHPILRTSFISGEVSAQAVWQGVPLPFTLIDITHLSYEEQKSHLLAFSQSDYKQGFQIQQAPLFRLTLFSLAEQHHYLLWSFHHILLDGWSISLLFQEFLTRYEALSQGKEPLIQASRPYRDYIAWLQLQDQFAAEQFWRNELQGINSSTPLPLKSNHTSLRKEQKLVYRHQYVQLSRQISQQIQTVAR